MHHAPGAGLEPAQDGKPVAGYVISRLNVPDYLARIEYAEPLKPDAETLRLLQLAHLRAVPFENLDIGLGREIRLTEQALWEKIVERRRGGFCYELNGLFAWLLRAVGFEVTYLNARDYHPEDDSFGLDFDHLALLVRAPGHSRRWLADVGYGDTFTRPLQIDDREEQVDGLRGYTIEPFRDGYIIWQRGYEGEKKEEYFFDLVPHQFPHEYEAMCRYHQTSPQSIFTRKRIITRLTPEGRLSIDDHQVIATRDGVKDRRPLRDEGDFHDLLQREFGFGL
jgi:N-hydroxyarylamine O-acetyltransferase